MQQLMMSEQDNFDACLFNECFSDKIIERKYQKETTEEVADLQEHLTPQ